MARTLSTAPVRSDSAKRVSAPSVNVAAKTSKSKTSGSKKAPVKPAAVPGGAVGSAKKPKLVRDSFTLPQQDHDLIKQCKKLAMGQGRETKKSEVLRAAIQSFASLPVPKQMAAYRKLESIAVGRPKSA